MTKIKGITITLIDRVEIDKDPFGHPVYKDKEIQVNNVLVAPVSTDDIVNSLELEGKKVVYVLGIPKGDTNNWENKEIRFFGQRFKSFGKVTQGIDHLIPLDWNKKVKVEVYE